MIFYNIKVKGVGGWVHELLSAPFGSHPLLWPANFPNLALNIVEYVSKPVSLAAAVRQHVRGRDHLPAARWLLGGMRTSARTLGARLLHLCGHGWAIFHILIVLLQAYIFMMLTIVYISMAHEHH